MLAMDIYISVLIHYLKKSFFIYSNGLFHILWSDSISGMFHWVFWSFCIQVNKYSGEVSVFVLFSGFNAIMVTEEIKK